MNTKALNTNTEDTLYRLKLRTVDDHLQKIQRDLQVLKNLYCNPHVKIKINSEYLARKVYAAIIEYKRIKASC